VFYICALIPVKHHMCILDSLIFINVQSIPFQTKVSSKPIGQQNRQVQEASKPRRVLFILRSLIRHLSLSLSQGKWPRVLQCLHSERD